jgi:hypothetical protein
LAQSLQDHREEAYLFRTLATLRNDVPLAESINELEWRGAHSHLKELCLQLGDKNLLERITTWVEG